MKKTFWKIIFYLFIIFFVCLLIYFPLHTFLKFKLWLNLPTIIWIRKELFIVFLATFILFNLKTSIFFLKENKTLTFFSLFLVIATIWLFWISFFANNDSIKNFIISYRYIWFGFFLFIFSYISVWIIWKIYDKNFSNKLKKNLFLIVKFLLIFNLIWYIFLLAYPERLNFLWYNLDINNILRLPNHAPQWVFKTWLRKWYIRNQSIFSGPLSLWFFLLWIWPFFIVNILKWKFINKQKNYTNLKKIIRIIIFILNIFSTFSRSIIWIFIIQIIFLFVYSTKNYRIKIWKEIKNNKIYKCIFAISILWSVSVFLVWSIFVYNKINKTFQNYNNFQNWIINQKDLPNFSNFWHIEYFFRWVKMIKEKPIFWRWAGSAWPSSYFLKEKYFNPENQYLQVIIEYWLTGFFLWFIVFILFPIILIKLNKKNYTFVLWRFGILLAWLILHSFSDITSLYLSILLML